MVQTIARFHLWTYEEHHRKNRLENKLVGGWAANVDGGDEYVALPKAAEDAADESV
jgi:hypothetical protein